MVVAAAASAAAAAEAAEEAADRQVVRPTEVRERDRQN